METEAGGEVEAEYEASGGATFEGAVRYALKMVGKKDLDLESKQLEAMEALYNEKDVFLMLPTGYGKSICYECLPFLYDYKLHLTATPSQRTTVLVISPLVSRPFSVWKSGSCCSGRSSLCEQME